MKKPACFWLISLSLGLFLSAGLDRAMAQQNPGFEPEGPVYYHLRQGVTFYVANPDGKPFTARVDLKDLNVFCMGEQTALLKAYAPDGAVLFEEDLPDDGITDGGYQQARAGFDHEMWAWSAVRDLGAEPLFRWDAFSNPKKVDKIAGLTRTIEVDDAVPGVYQIIVAGCDDHFVKIDVSGGLKYGVLGHPDYLAGHGEQLRTSYLYVPEVPYYARPRRAILALIDIQYPRNRRVSVLDGDRALPMKGTPDEDGATVLTPGEVIGRGVVDLTGVAPGTVLKVVTEGDGDFLLRVSGIPGILCPDPETARFIAGGLTKLDDGPVVTFPFQRKLWDAVKNLKKEDFDFGVDPDNWGAPVGAERAKIMVHGWRSTHDPANVTKAMQAVSKAIADMKTFSVHKLYENLPGVNVGDLIIYYRYPFAGNRLYGNPAVRNVVTLALIKEWMKYRAGEVIYENAELNVAYAQGFHWDYWEPVWNMKEGLDPAVLAAFQQGLRRIAQRMFYANGLELVITNGRTTVPMNIYHAYLVTDDPALKELALRHFRRMYTALDGPHSGWSKTGYFREHFAADGGYCTYPLYQIGRLYQLSQDPEVLECLDALCRWMCYCAMPYGDTWYGPTSWNARIGVSALEHIWGSGYKWIADESEWAATLYRHYQKGAAVNGMEDPKMEPGKPVPDNKPTLLLTHLTRGVLPARTLPCDSETPFFTDVGGGHELFAIRRGGYYALVYAGKRTPYFQDHLLGGTNSFNGGGLTGLYVPALRRAPILGRVRKEYGFPRDRWPELSVPVVVGEMASGQIFNTGVSRNQVEWNADNWMVRTTGEAVGAPINYERTYIFGEDAIHASVTIQNADLAKKAFLYTDHFNKVDKTIATAWELIPCAYNSDVSIVCLDADGRSMGDLSVEEKADVKSVEIRIGTVGGVRIVLDEPRVVRLSQPNPDGKAAKGARSVQIQMADMLPDAQPATLSYRLETF